MTTIAPVFSIKSSFFIISATTAFYEITLKIYGEMKKVHCPHSQSLHELSQDLGHRLVLLTVRPCARLIKQTERSQRISLLILIQMGVQLAKHILCVSMMTVHSSYLEWIDESSDWKSHRFLWLYRWCIHERHKAAFLSLDTWVQLLSNCEFDVFCVRKTAKTLEGVKKNHKWELRCLDFDF